MLIIPFGFSLHHTIILYVEPLSPTPVLSAIHVTLNFTHSLDGENQILYSRRFEAYMHKGGGVLHPLNSSYQVINLYSTGIRVWPAINAYSTCTLPPLVHVWFEGIVGGRRRYGWLGDPVRTSHLYKKSHFSPCL
jgi:hypothetical protein